MHFRQVDGQYRQSVGQQPDSFVSGADIMDCWSLFAIDPAQGVVFVLQSVP